MNDEHFQWQPGDTTHEDLSPVWDAVCRAHPILIEHITGPTRHDAIGLEQCVRAFHAHAVRLHLPIHPRMLVVMFGAFPDGAFAGGAGSELFAKDVAKLFQDCVDEARERRRQEAELAEQLFDPWADPTPPAWPAGILAPAYEDTIAAIALADGVDMGAQALAFITAASGAANKQSRLDVYLNGRFLVPPIVWTMVIAPSGMRKTPILTSAFTCIKRRIGQGWSDYRRAMQHHEAMTAEERKNEPKPTEPASLIVDDITPEKLAELLGNDPHGLLMLKEELVSLFDFGRYSKGAGAGARGFMLTTHDGGETWFQRKSSGTTHIANAAMAIFGCTQPNRLAAFKDLEDDGLLQRFLISRPPVSRSLGNPDVAVKGVEALERTILGLIHRDPMRYRLTKAGAPMVRATEEQGLDLERLADMGVGFPAWVRKMHGQHARLALVLHLMETPDDLVIADGVVERAARLMRDYLLPHAHGFYSALPDNRLALVRSAAGWLLTKAPERFTAAHVQRGVAGCAGKPLRFIQDLLDPLVTGGWLEPETDFPNNRAWKLLPGVRHYFAARTQAERERRAALAKALQGTEDR